MGQQKRRIAAEMENNEKNGSDAEDRDLLRCARSGEEQALNRLLEKYKQMVRISARSLFLAGGDQEDLLQEGMLGLFRAIREYDLQQETSFAAYARVAVRNQMYSAVIAARRKKHAPLNTSLSLHEMEDRAGKGELGLAESPESIVLAQEAKTMLREKIRKMLSPYEKKVLQEYLQGLDYLEIAEKLGKTPKSVDNALQRIRNKVSGFCRR